MESLEEPWPKLSDDRTVEVRKLQRHDRREIGQLHLIDTNCFHGTTLLAQS
jgi:hypothetical protein